MVIIVALWHLSCCLLYPSSFASSILEETTLRVLLQAGAVRKIGIPLPSTPSLGLHFPCGRGRHQCYRNYFRQAWRRGRQHLPVPRLHL